MLLEKIAEKKSERPDMKQPVRIQDHSTTWQKVTLWRPRRSVNGVWLYPTQKVWRYQHLELCRGGTAREMSIYQRWFYLYLTDEEYVMAKMEA